MCTLLGRTIRPLQLHSNSLPFCKNTQMIFAATVVENQGFRDFPQAPEKEIQKAPKGCFREAKMAPRSASGGARTRGAKTAPRPPKTAPRGAQTASRPPKTAQNGPRTAKSGPKAVKSTPRAAKKRPREAQEAPKRLTCQHPKGAYNYMHLLAWISRLGRPKELPKDYTPGGPKTT